MVNPPKTWHHLLFYPFTSLKVYGISTIQHYCIIIYRLLFYILYYTYILCIPNLNMFFFCVVVVLCVHAVVKRVRRCFPEYFPFTTPPSNLYIKEGV